jgi:hypothetical protein
VVVGIDPGLMTGVFIYQSGMPQPGFGLNREKVYPQIEGAHVPASDIPKYLRTTLSRWQDWAGHSGVHVAVERYIITARTAKLTQQSEALEVTGMVKAVADQYLSTEVRQYLKANLKFASDDMLSVMGWRMPKLRHANDAARQASALLKEVDYLRWCELVKGGTLDTTTNEETTG